MKYENHTAEFHNGTISVYHMDCMELLRQTPDKHFELSIIDPPYGIGDIRDGGHDVNSQLTNTSLLIGIIKSLQSNTSMKLTEYQKIE